MTKRKMPVMVNSSFEASLIRFAQGKAKAFKRDIYPVLLEFGLLDDEHVQKYLSCKTMEEIYNDALLENRRSVLVLEQKAVVEEMKPEKERVDVWRFLRDPKSEVKSPKENGFIFARIPGSDNTFNDFVLKGISVKNLELLIDEKVYTDLSTINPSAEQQECYDMIAGMCDTFNQWNRKRQKHMELFFTNENGVYVPNLHTILNLQWLRKK